jgi:uncharacterized coiled-coil protein SlyX
MVVGKEQFERAMTEINESYAIQNKRIAELEAAIEELQKTVGKLTPKTRAKTTKAA